jgi:hypothetical protein
MSPLISVELLGWAAAGLTLAMFICRDMLRLRALALAANMAFIGYGLSAGLWPVVTLHLLLVPLNLQRLVELRRTPTLASRRRAKRRATRLFHIHEIPSFYRCTKPNGRCGRRAPTLPSPLLRAARPTRRGGARPNHKLQGLPMDSFHRPTFRFAPSRRAGSVAPTGASR